MSEGNGKTVTRTEAEKAAGGLVNAVSGMVLQAFAGHFSSMQRQIAELQQRIEGYEKGINNDGIIEGILNNLNITEHINYTTLATNLDISELAGEINLDDMAHTVTNNVNWSDYFDVSSIAEEISLDDAIDEAVDTAVNIAINKLTFNVTIK